MDAEGGAHRERLDELLEHAVGEQLDDDHPAGGLGAGAAERDQDRERARGPRADVGDVATDERDRDDRPDQRHAEHPGAQRDDERR